MAALTHDAALVHPGSLLTPDGRLVAPYDLAHDGGDASGHAPASDLPGLRHAALGAFQLDYPTLGTVHVINGMGVALGDSVIGLTALAALRARHPALRFVLYRPALAPAYVDALYQLAAATIAPYRRLPWPAARLPAGDLVVDVGNHLYWPAFAAQPMIDFFLSALGAAPGAIPADAKRNRWLAALALPALPPAWQGRRYTLFCPTASTPLRSLPTTRYAALVAMLADTYGLPVLGFEPVDHPAYVDVHAYSADTAHFIAWVKHASMVFATDTSAVHLAAGFDVPTLACFTTIAPALRVRDYPHCVGVALPVPDAWRGRHTGASLHERAELDARYRAFDWSRIAWPQARDPGGD
jgi:hypothetical protein